MASYHVARLDGANLEDISTISNQKTVFVTLAHQSSYDFDKRENCFFFIDILCSLSLYSWLVLSVVSSESKSVSCETNWRFDFKSDWLIFICIRSFLILFITSSSQVVGRLLKNAEQDS